MGKIFWGVLLALLVFSGVMFTLFALGVVGAQAAQQEATRQWLAEQKAESDAQRKAAAEALERRRLNTYEQCVAGTVVLVTGSVYTQVLDGDLHPVGCAGRYRLR